MRLLAHALKVSNWRFIAAAFLRRFWSDDACYGLRRDLSIPFDPPAARIFLTVRALQEKDFPRLFNREGPDVSPDEILWRMRRSTELEAGIKTCYVAVTPEGNPCYAEWLIGAVENEKLQNTFRGEFPVLKPDEAILERAFTLQPYRLQGIMANAMAQIAEAGRDLGARWVMTFVCRSNAPALKGCQKAGFEVFMVRREKWRFFRQRFAFELFPPGRRLISVGPPAKTPERKLAATTSL